MVGGFCIWSGVGAQAGEEGWAGRGDFESELKALERHSLGHVHVYVVEGQRAHVQP